MNKIVLINLLTTALVKSLNFFAAPFFSRQLGAANYGIFSVYASWVGIASIVFSLQAGETVGIAKEYFSESEQKAYQSSVLSLATASYAGFSALTLCLAWALSRFFTLHMSFVFFTLLQGWGLYCVGFINSKFVFEFNPIGNLKLSALTSILSVGVPVLLLRHFPAPSNYWALIIGQSCSYGLLGCALFSLILWKGRTLFHSRYWAFTLPIAFPTIFHLLANVVLHQSDKIMLQMMLSSEMAGIYALANAFGQILRSLWEALNKSWVPFYYRYLSVGNVEELKNRTRHYVELFTTLTIGFILMGQEVFHIYAQRDFWSGAGYAPIFVISHYFTFLYSFPVNYEFFHKKTKLIALGTSLTAALNMILNFLFIRFLGGIGAVVATMLSHIGLFAFHYINAQRIRDEKFPLTLKELLSGAPFVFLAYLMYAVTPQFPILRWSVSFALGFRLLLKIIKRREIF